MPDSTVLTNLQAIPDASIRWFLLRESLLERLRRDDYAALTRNALPEGVQGLSPDIYSEFEFAQRVEDVRRATWEATDEGENSYLLEQGNDLLRTFGINEIDDDSFAPPVTVKLVTVDIRVTLRVRNSQDADETDEDVRGNLRVLDNYVDDSYALSYDITDVSVEIDE